MFEQHTIESAPAKSAEIMTEAQKAFGFVPNLHGNLAEAPAAIQTYVETMRTFSEETGFSALEQQVVLMTANRFNGCHYCTAGHSMIMKMSGMPQDVIEALRNEQSIQDEKLEALRIFTLGLLENRGHIGDEGLAAFLAAGYTKKHALEVIVGLAAKVISNYTNALAHTELDEPIKPFAVDSVPA